MALFTIEKRLRKMTEIDKLSSLIREKTISTDWKPLINFALTLAVLVIRKKNR